MFGRKRKKQALEESIRAQFPRARVETRPAVPSLDVPAGWFSQMAVLPPSRRRVWVIGGIYGRLAPLQALHDQLIVRFGRDDALVYAGNMIGHGPDSAAVVDEILLARRRLLALHYHVPEDIVWIRGGQEELWRKLLELQYVAQPQAAWQWLLQNGARPVVESFGGVIDAGSEAIRGGTQEINRWCASLRKNVFGPEGHNAFFANLRHAATTRQEPDDTGGLLISAAGLDPDRNIQKMGDHFWWNHKGFDRMDAPWQGFSCVIRGNNPDAESGLSANAAASRYSLGDGIDAPLQAVCFTKDGGIDDRISLTESKKNDAIYKNRVA